MSTRGSLKFCAWTSELISAVLREGGGSTGRRQRGEKRSDLARACQSEGEGGRNGSSGGIDPRGSGTHHSASSLSDARTGASSTEKSSFISPIRRGRARARRSLRASHGQERTSASFKLPCGLPRASDDGRPTARARGCRRWRPPPCAHFGRRCCRRGTLCCPAWRRARVARRFRATRDPARLARAASLPPRAATRATPSAPSRWLTRTSAAISPWSSSRRRSRETRAPSRERARRRASRCTSSDPSDSPSRTPSSSAPAWTTGAFPSRHTPRPPTRPESTDAHRVTRRPALPHVSSTHAPSPEPPLPRALSQELRVRQGARRLGRVPLVLARRTRLARSTRRVQQVRRAAARRRGRLQTRRLAPVRRGDDRFTRRRARRVRRDGRRATNPHRRGARAVAQPRRIRGHRRVRGAAAD